jgi:hypothetical protein
METEHKQINHAENPHKKSPQKISFRGHSLPCVMVIPTDSNSRLPKKHQGIARAGNTLI